MTNTMKSLLSFCATAFVAVGCQSQDEPATSGSITPAAATESDFHELSSDTHAEDAHASHGDSEVEAAMAKLSPEDRKEAETQKFCVISNGSLLGSMGTPIKLDINGQSVFVCCSGCKSAAMKDPEKTLATVAGLKAENSELPK